MTKCVYFVGAGLTRSLQMYHPVPLMADFVRIMADYITLDETGVILTTLAEFELAGIYSVPCPETASLANLVVGKNADRTPKTKAKFTECLRNRPAESVEDLLAKSVQANLLDRFRYAINRIFSLIGWQVNLPLLEAFLSDRFKDDNLAHCFISFNYDLVLEKALERTVTCSWRPATGYGYPIEHQVFEEPSAKPSHAAEVVGLYGESAVLVLKPHGSLNWLLPLEVPYRSGSHGLSSMKGPLVLPLSNSGELEYWNTTATFNYLQVPGQQPADYGIFIVPPLRDKVADQPFLKQVLEWEVNVIAEADEIFVLGYSLPTTDSNQEELIRKAVEMRDTPLRRLTVVNYRASSIYYQRIAEIFSFPLERMEIADEGFEQFVAQSRP